MTEYKRHVLVVCGYGCHLVPVLQKYLDRVVEFIKREQPDRVIFCGGPTQRKSAPGVLEATLMAQYIGKHLSYPESAVPYDKEQNSYTTLYNIKGAANIIQWHFESEPVKITIFCEAQRVPNIDQLARHFMKDLVDKDDHIDIETASWERADPFKQAYNLIYNKLAIKYPWLGLAERERRKRIKRAESI